MRFPILRRKNHFLLQKMEKALAPPAPSPQCLRPWIKLFSKINYHLVWNQLLWSSYLKLLVCSWIHLTMLLHRWLQYYYFTGIIHLVRTQNFPKTNVSYHVTWNLRKCSSSLHSERMSFCVLLNLLNAKVSII